MDRSDGNPFFVEELLAEGRSSDASGIPPTIQDVIEVRLNALPDETQRVVRIAAVVGRQAEHDLLADLAGLSEVELIAAIRPAVDGHVLVPTEGDGRPRYAFRHALVREVAYDDLLPTERSALHRLVAEALSAQADADEADARSAAELAYHWSGAHDDRRALEASLRAARTATEIYAHDEALEHYERAIRLWDRVPEAATETGNDLASLYDGAASAASNAGNVRRAAELARAAVEGGPVGHTGALGEAWARRTDRLAWYLSELGDQAGGLAVVDQALGWVGSDFPGIGTARLLTTRGMLLWGMGRYPEIVRTADATIEAARRSGDVGIEASALLGVGAGRAAYGLLDDGIADLRAAHALFLAADDARTGIAMSQLCYALGLAGRHPEAAALIGEELDRQARIGTLRRFRPFLVTDLVDSYLELGRWDEAVALCEAEIAQADGGRAAPWYLETLGEIRALRGDVEGATELLAAASEAVGPGDAVIDRVWLMRTAIVLGRIEGNIDRVRSAVDEALGISADPAHDAVLWWLLCAGLAVEADEADRAGRQDANGLATARERGQRIARILDEAAAALGPDDTVGRRRFGRSFASRRPTACGSRDSADVAAWVASIEAYDDLDYVYDAAICRLRLAETILAAGAAREDATAALRAAADIAARLRAEPLLAAVVGLAGRARIDLGTPADGGDDLGVGLTAREQEVLGLLAGGLTNREIGEALFISDKTASVHVSNILGKLGVGGRGAAVAMAMRLGFGMDAEASSEEARGRSAQRGPHVATCLPDDPDEAGGGGRAAGCATARRRSSGSAPTRSSRPAGSRRDHLDLELEPALVAAERRLHDPPPDQPVAGLVVGDRPADRPRECPAAELVGEAARGRHRPEVAPADDEIRMRLRLVRGDELRYLRRVVLAVGIERENGVIALGDGAFESEAERGTLALVRALFDDRRARGTRPFGGVVRRAVVNDEDRQVAQRRLDDRPDPWALVVARDQGDEAGRHGAECTGLGRRSAPSSDRSGVEADPDQEDGRCGPGQVLGDHIGQEDVADRAALRTVAFGERRQRTDEPIRGKDGAFGQRDAEGACRATGRATPQPVEEHDENRRGDHRERDGVDALDRGEGNSLTHGASVAGTGADGMGLPARLG